MGKLFFYSDQVVESPGNRRLDTILLEGLKLKKSKLGYIPSTEDREKTHFNMKARYYRHYGIQDIMFFDLYNEFDPSKTDELLKCDIIHLAAGNPIECRKVIKQRKMDEILYKYFKQGGTLVGVSGGAVQFGQSIKLFQMFIKDSNEELEGLQLVDFEFLPYYNRWDEDYKREVQNYARTTGTTIYAGNDGDGIIFENNEIQMIGEIVIISSQQ